MRWVAAAVLLMVATAAGAQDEKALPYWASIASGQAMTRTGPGKNYPGVWLYQRRDLPVRIVSRHDDWRLIEDSDGARGWMLSTLLSERRTAIVKPGEPRPVRLAPSVTARARYLAEPGVVGRIDKCANRFCRIEMGGKKGYIAQADLYGLSPGEVID